MLLLPSVFHGLMGVFLTCFLAISIFIFPFAFAEENNETWRIRIMPGAGDSNPSKTFYPDELPIAVGDTVEWINQDTVSHSIVSGIPDFPDYYGYFFSPGIVNPGESISFILEETDQLAFYYLCEIHPWMTGKLFLKDSEAAIPETANPIITEKESYRFGDIIEISGTVHEDFWGSEYQLLVYDSDNSVVEAVFGYFEDDASYSESFNTKNFDWEEGKYSLQLIYGLPSKVAQLNFDYDGKPDGPIIPEWIKNVGDFWCSSQIGDMEFVNAIQHLVKKEIISIDTTTATNSGAHQIPQWVKNNTCWWSEKRISDHDFILGLEFLIEQGTIKV